MTEDIEVGDLVISRTTREYRAEATPGRPALVIAVELWGSGARYIRLKVGSREWWDDCDACEKVS